MKNNKNKIGLALVLVLFFIIIIILSVFFAKIDGLQKIIGKNIVSIQDETIRQKCNETVAVATQPYHEGEDYPEQKHINSTNYDPFIGSKYFDGKVIVNAFVSNAKEFYDESIMWICYKRIEKPDYKKYLITSIGNGQAIPDILFFTYDNKYNISSTSNWNVQDCDGKHDNSKGHLYEGKDVDAKIKQAMEYIEKAKKKKSKTIRE